MMTYHPPALYQAKQQGAALFTVLVVVLLSLLLVLGASRTALFNELVTGNDADYQRALEAAQLLLKDAELDVNGYRDDKTPCNANAGYIGCRTVASNVYFPQSLKDDYPVLLDSVVGNTPPCSNGICSNLCPSATAGFCVGNDPRFWTTPALLALMTPNAVSATYGEFTLATPGATGNTILTANPPKAWYWVEVVPYAELYRTGNRAPNNPKAPFLYRITAVAQGNKQGTQAVVQTLVVVRKSAS